MKLSVTGLAVAAFILFDGMAEANQCRRSHRNPQGRYGSGGPDLNNRVQHKLERRLEPDQKL